MLWCSALTGFALASSYPVALALLFTAGFFELSFNAMAQTLVQLNAPPDMRGRVIGLFNMASLGLRTFSGVSVGLLGGLIGVHWSLGLSAMAMLAIASTMLALI
jgi:MFS family permease